MDAVNKVSEFVDRHVRIIQNVGYAVSAAGVVLLARRSRLFTKFRHVHDIPKHFVTRGIRLRGVVKEVSQEALKVEHIPSFSIPFSSLMKRAGGDSDECLNLRMAGVSLTEKGCVSMNNELQGKMVWFKLLRFVSDGESATPTMIYKRKMLVQRNMNIFAVRMGRGVVEALPDCDNPKVQNRLQLSLLKAQKRAAAKKLGVWSD